MHYLKPLNISLVSEDMLSLNYSYINLKDNGFENVKNYPTDLLSENLGKLLIWTLDSEEYFELSEYKFNKLKKIYSDIIISGEKSKINRLIKKNRIKPIDDGEFGEFKAVFLKI